ncbi:MAG: hypothetical protein KF843_05945 [Flavobacteriales bacterium]|nr:hypothetical protein [Flavobacteriales bacterium]
MLLTLLVVFAIGCSSDDKLTENYWIYDDPIIVEGRHALMCKLGCDGDPVISNVAEVQWNDKVIMVTTRSDKHYLILAKGERLKCCNGDSILGPMDDQQFQEQIGKGDFGDELKTKKYD